MSKASCVNDVHSTTQTTKFRRLVGPSLVVLVLLVGGSVAWYGWARPTVRAERLFVEARSLHSTGDHLEAERYAVKALQLDPTLGEAALLAAESAAARNEFRRAIELTRQTTSAEPRIRLQAHLLAAQLNHHRLYRFSDAERAYRAALQIDPDHIEANVGLAKLLGLCARRTEAIPHILRVVRQGEPTDLLILLGRDSGMINDPDALQRARQAAPDDPNPLLGLAWHAAEDGQTEEAIELLRQAIRLQPDHAAAHVALGRQLLAARRFRKLVRWSNRLPPAAEDFAETWNIRGRMAENNGDRRAAIRCYWEAARRSPESKTANYRLAQLLAEVGQSEAAERFATRVLQLQQLEDVQNRYVASAGYLLELAKTYEAAGRLWEAYGWCQTIIRHAPEHDGARRYLEKLRPKVEDIPLRLTADTANIALTVDLSSYPLPRFQQPSAASTAVSSVASGGISFRNDAASTGLHFRYFNGTDRPPSRKMYEFTGGGIGVLDFDLDGFPDIYFTQGRPWPPETSAGGYYDRFFRNRGGVRFEDVTVQTGLQEDGFGQGVAVGDFNADGFPDLYVANIGANQLWRNNGDGTFTDVTQQALTPGPSLSGRGVRGEGNEWTTSCVVADLNGDALPDIYDVNYVTGPQVFERVCRHDDGSPGLCMPFRFDGQSDRLWRNDGEGRFRDATAEVLSTTPNGKGLGAAVWDADGTGRLSLLVANDTTPNLFFIPEVNGDGLLRLQERGIPSGLALNENGKAEGCMGIALADVDGDGRLDVHVTNFLAESNTLWMNVAKGGYVDRTREMGLASPTLDKLGFGTQFLDADLDGRLELFVSNGHVDDLRRFGRPYKMPPQLFRWTGQRFAEVNAAELGPYFRTNWLGRPVARLDWNRDGREDLAVGHLVRESALLTNTTRNAGRFLSLKLVGVQSNRDAIGTVVRARLGDRTVVHQLTAGDGYQASNERRLVFGLGDAKHIDELIVKWPSGTVQSFPNVPLSRELWLVEGNPLVTAPGLDHPFVPAREIPSDSADDPAEDGPQAQ